MTLENERRKQAEELIDRLLDWILANRNTDGEFIRCFSYGHMERPQVIADAKKFLGESISRYTIVPDEEEE